eukprot:gb/GECG01001851.1/.p1 GENE.gb/GECG01001851.1/~~gb/GECG01001851.1/.p1  ORF type:complete len:160 (+),score=21.01 gb/GECG01001851.1/:1-480(+)
MRTLGGISLLLGALLCSQAAQALPFSQKRRFIQREFYNERPGDQCNSFDFTQSDLGEDDHFEFCQGEIGGSGDSALKCGAAWINSVSTNKDDFFCIGFTWSQDQSSKYLWVRNDGTKALKASDCDGDPPLSMYQADTSPYMCGEIPSQFTRYVYSMTNG